MLLQKSLCNLIEMKSHNYYVYIITNKVKTVLYTGVTNDLSRRIKEHQLAETKQSFTAKYNTFYLIHFERFQWINDAIRREKEIKGWRRSKKVELINSNNPNWEFLNETLE